MEPIDFQKLIVHFGTLSWKFTHERFFLGHDYRKHEVRLEFNFASKDSELLFSALQVKDKTLADKIEISRVNAIMMRTISFGLFLVGVAKLANFIRREYNTSYLWLALVSWFASFISVKQAARYDQWFYKDIFKSATVCGDSLQAVLESPRKEMNTKRARL